MKKGHVIKSVDPGSIGDELGLEPGDQLLAIDGRRPEDIFDYEYYIQNESVEVLIRKADGEEWELDIENDYEDLGLTFENGLMSEYRSCRNRCIFCFIDQMPKGMRDTLYFKDDDSRLSFLQGNYITLTNMSQKDIDRIIRFKLAPINISVHTTNPGLRCKMLNNRFAGEALKNMDRLFEAGTPMNGQIVMCKNINDKAELERTIRDLSRYIPCMESVSVVPVGLSRFREGLYPLEPITREDARETIDIVERWQEKLYKSHGTHFIHASDEFYILAGRPLPETERYDGFVQLENGVGMIRLMTDEVEEALARLEGDQEEEELSVATGLLAYDYLNGFLEKIREKFPRRRVYLYPVVNRFFGEQITVAGLITGRDLIEQLRGKPLGSRLLLPSCMFRSGEEVFLDDVTRQEVKTALQVPVNIVKSSGQDFVNAVLYPPEEGPVFYEGYELP
jgi:putative radical SAM enzyme (TIGR03279 family)